MKSKIPLILLLLLTAVVAKSQESKFRLGLGFKAIESSLSSKPYLLIETVNAFSPSIIVDYKLTKRILISSGIEYERKGGETDQIGYRYNENGRLFYKTTVFDLDFIQIPVFATYKTNGKVKFFVNAGLNMGYLFNQTIEPKDKSLPKLDMDHDEFELSLLLGGGVEVKCTDRIDLSLGIRNNRGLNGLESGNGVFTFETNTMGVLLNLSYNL